MATKNTGERTFYGAGGAETIIDPAVFGEERLAQMLAEGILRTSPDAPAEPAAEGDD